MAFYGTLYSTGHDSSLNMQILTSIIQKGIRQSFTFEHSYTATKDGNKFETLDIEIPFSTFALCEKILTHADPENFKKGTIVPPCQHILTCLSEDVGAALTIDAFAKCKKLFENAIEGLTKKPSAARFIKKKDNVIALIALVNYITALPKSRAAATAFPVAISKWIDEDPINILPLDYDDTLLKQWFHENILFEDEFGPKGEMNRERIAAWNLCICIDRQEVRDAMEWFALLWMSNPFKIKKSSPSLLDSKYDLIGLVWLCLRYFLEDDVDSYKFLYDWLQNVDNKPLALYPICALFRACKFNEQEVSKACENYEELYHNAVKHAKTHFRVLIMNNEEIHPAWDDEDTYYLDDDELEDARSSFKNAVLDMHTAPGAAQKKSYEHFFDVACKVFPEAFQDPFHDKARVLYVENKKSFSNMILEIMENYPAGFAPNNVCNAQPLEVDQDLEDVLDFIDATARYPDILEEDPEISELLDEVDDRKKRKAESQKERKNSSKRTQNFINLAAAEKFFKAVFIKDEPESEIFPTILRVQALTNKDKARTFWALNEHVEEVDQDVLFVKGPFKNRDSLMAHMISNHIKRSLHSDYIEPIKMIVFDMIPDRSDDDSDKHGFLICEDLMGVEPRMFKDDALIIETNTSIEIGIRLLDREKANLSSYELSKSAVETLDENASLRFIMNLLYRYAFRINDTCFGNLIYNQESGIIYSVDEANLFAPTTPKTLMSKPLDKGLYLLVRKWLKRHWDTIDSELERWATVVEDEKFERLFQAVGYETNKVVNAIQSLRNLDLLMSLL